MTTVADDAVPADCPRLDFTVLQAARARSFGRRHVAARTRPGGVEPEKLERGVVSQVA